MAIARHINDKVTIVLDNRNVQYHLYIESRYDEVMKSGKCRDDTSLGNPKQSDGKRRRRSHADRNVCTSDDKDKMSAIVHESSTIECTDRSFDSINDAHELAGGAPTFVDDERSKLIEELALCDDHVDRGPMIEPTPEFTERPQSDGPYACEFTGGAPNKVDMTSDYASEHATRDEVIEQPIDNVIINDRDESSIQTDCVSTDEAAQSNYDATHAKIEVRLDDEVILEDDVRQDDEVRHDDEVRPEDEIRHDDDSTNGPIRAVVVASTVDIPGADFQPIHHNDNDAKDDESTGDRLVRPNAAPPIHNHNNNDEDDNGEPTYDRDAALVIQDADAPIHNRTPCNDGDDGAQPNHDIENGEDNNAPTDDRRKNDCDEEAAASLDNLVDSNRENVVSVVSSQDASPSVCFKRVSFATIRRLISSMSNDERMFIRNVFPNMARYELSYVQSSIVVENGEVRPHEPVPLILAIASFQKKTKRGVIEFIVSKINRSAWFGYYENLIWGTVTEMLHTRQLLTSYSCEDVKMTYRAIHSNETERRLIHSVLLFSIIKEIVDGNTMLLLTLCMFYYPYNLMCFFESDVFAIYDLKNEATICIGRDRDSHSLLF